MATALIAPLDWGLGHASRSLALAARLESEGWRVVLAGSGHSGAWMQEQRPDLDYLEFPSFTLTYSASNRQVWAVLRSLPRLLACVIREHRAARRLVRLHGIDLRLSDNRFGLFGCGCRSIYLTHQVHIELPRPYRWLSRGVDALHRSIMRRFDECWIPDFPKREQSLSGVLGHPDRLPANACYIGPLSRFRRQAPASGGGTLWLLSGVEPQRTLLERQLLGNYADSQGPVDLVRGTRSAGLPRHLPKGVRVWDLPDRQCLEDLIRRADRIVARSGYSTIMDLEAMGKLKVAEWRPTPGQPEQEYLAVWLSQQTIEYVEAAERPHEWEFMP